MNLILSEKELTGIEPIHSHRGYYPNWYMGYLYCLDDSQYKKELLKGYIPPCKQAEPLSIYMDYVRVTGIKNIPTCILEIIEGSFCSNPFYAYTYSLSFLKGRFKKGEKIISTDSHYSTYYAINVLKGKFDLVHEDMLLNEKGYGSEYVDYLYEKGILPEETSKDKWISACVNFMLFVGLLTFLIYIFPS